MLEERDEIAVAGDNNDGVEAWCEFDGVHGNADVPVCFFCAADEDLKIFEFDFKADAVKCFVEGCFIFLSCADCVGDCADKFSAADGIAKNRAKVNFCVVQVACRIVHVLDINKDADALFFTDHFLVRIIEIAVFNDF